LRSFGRLAEARRRAKLCETRIGVAKLWRQDGERVGELGLDRPDGGDASIDLGIGESPCRRP
jgi:hypothetical protein